MISLIPLRVSRTAADVTVQSIAGFCVAVSCRLLLFILNPKPSFSRPPLLIQAVDDIALTTNVPPSAASNLLVSST